MQVDDLDLAIAFYRDNLGFNLTADWSESGFALLAAGDYHRHIGLSARQNPRATPRPHGHSGLDHVALLYPGRRELGHAIRRLLDRGFGIDRGTDHGINVSVYLSDPDGNGIELYYDRPRAQWFDRDGRPRRYAEPFDPNDLVLPPTTGR